MGIGGTWDGETGSWLVLDEVHRPTVRFQMGILNSGSIGRYHCIYFRSVCVLCVLSFHYCVEDFILEYIHMYFKFFLYAMSYS